MLVLSATTYLGVLIVPCVVLIRGYVLGCTTAACYVSEGSLGLVAALLVIGVPTLLTLPALICLSERCAVRSGELLHLRFAHDHSQYRTRIDLPVILFTLLVLMIVFAYSALLLPRILTLI